ncbi:MAG: T9SS type A sorting domain-containing protein [Saprospiraceae bacterium]|nr:T9SS type A sorting domain-containing protein [Saprospiraceae bacterium]
MIDFDPGATAKLTPKFEDHVFVPAFWQVTNVNSPIAGILFNDQTKRKVSGQIAGGLCKKAIIESGEFAYIKVRSVDGCFEKLVEITNQEGNFEIDSLPPLERMTVAVIHDNPFIDKFFNDQGAPTVNLSKQDTTVEFIYFAQPQIEVVSGLEPLSATCNVIVMDQYERKELVIKLKEQYVVTTSDDGVCYIDSASIRIINGFADTTVEAKISNGFLSYKYIVGKPNPTPPYLKTLQLISTTLEGNRGEYTTQGVVTGIFEKLPTFVTQLPETPTLVLHDPPGDGSYAFIEKGQKICEKITLSSELNVGGGIQTILDLVPDIKVPIFFGVPNVEFESEIGPTVTAVTTISKISNNSMEVCKTFNQRFSTSEDDLIVGAQGGDLFVGAGLNINFGFANVIYFDSTLCQPIDTLSATIQPRQYGTTFMYSEYYIKKTVIPYLDTLITLTSDTNEINRYKTSVLRWKNMLKNDSIRTANAKPLKNISFDAGVTYEYSETIDSLFSETEATNTDIKGSYDYSIIIKGNGAGGGVVLKAQIESISSNSKDNNNEKGVTTGYVLKDDDVLDAFSVDIAIDSVYKTPIFKVVAGQSSCPWEPGTAKREGVLLTSVDGPVRTDVPANEPAVFHLLLGNISATNESRSYAFKAGPKSNPDGAKISCNGAPMNQIQWYTIPWGTTIPVTVTVERGPVEYSYDSLAIELYSACEEQRENEIGGLPDSTVNIYSAVYVSAFFIRPCSEVVINEPEQNFVIFPDPLTAGPDIVKKVVVSGYNTDPKFKSMSLQYRRSNGDGTWIAFPDLSEKYNPKWEGRPGIVGPYDTLSHRNYDFFDWNTLGFNDGDYEIRAVTNCSGDASDKPGYSEIIKGRIDRSPPALLGVPQPSDGVYNVGDEISFTFNQNINCQKFMQLQILGSTLKDAATDSIIGITRSCVENKIVLTPDFANSEFENKILRAELHNIEDLVGNKNMYEQWEFYVDRNELGWLTDSISLTKYGDQTKTITANIHNRGGYPVPYTITAPDYIRVTPNRGTMVANEVETISFTVDSLVQLGEFSDSIIMHTETGINTFFMGGDEILNMHTRVICRPDKWVINPDGFNSAGFSYSMNYTLELNIEGTLSTDEEDIVGAYVGPALRGVSKVKFYPELNKYLAFLTVYSNVANGETVEFQIWDASQCKLYASTLENFEFLADDIIGSPLVPQVIHTNNQLLRKIYIHPGWNWISFNLDLLTPDINGGLSSLTNPTASLIKSQTDFSVFATSTQSWVGSLDSLFSFPMYQYNTPAYDSISMVGAFLDPETPMHLHAGWNWIGYLPHQGLSITEALSTLSPQTGDIIKSQITFAQYVDNIGWVGNLNYLNAPNGYLIKLNTADTLAYPDPLGIVGNNPSAKGITKLSYSNGNTLVQSTATNAMPYSHWQVDPAKFEHNMNVIAIVVKQAGNDNLLDENDEVAAFVGNKVRGSSKATFIPALNVFMVFMTVYANEEGETLTFKYYDASETKEINLVDKTNFKINRIWGNVDAPQPLQLSQVSGTNDVHEKDHPVTMYPNPFTNQLNIHFNASADEEVKVEFTDVQGSIVDEKVTKVKHGANEILWKPKSSLVGGTYFVKIHGNFINHTQRVLYIR